MRSTRLHVPSPPCRISISISPGTMFSAARRSMSAPINGGLNINSVPDRAVIGIDIRTIPGQSHAKIRDQLASYLGGDVALSTLLDAQSVWTSPMIAWIGEVFRITRDIAGFGDEIAAAPYFTDASVLTPAIGSPPTASSVPANSALAIKRTNIASWSRASNRQPRSIPGSDGDESEACGLSHSCATACPRGGHNTPPVR